MSNRNKILLGVLGAAAAGVVVGLLIAPEKGKDMRKKIKDTAGDWADNLGHLWAKAKNKAEDVEDEIRDKASRVKSAAQS